MQVGDDAKYLLEPPNSASAMPPVPSTSLQILPTHALTPQNMERLTLRVGETEGDGEEYAAIYEVSGQKQDGIDALFRLADGTYRLIQSRRIKEVTASRLHDAVSDFFKGKWAKKASSFVYATSAFAADTKVQDEIVKQAARLKKDNITFDVWDDDRISRKLKDRPKLVEDFLGVDVLRAFLPDQAGPALAKQLLDALRPELLAAVESGIRNQTSGTATPTAPDAADGLLDLVLVSGDLAPDIREVLEELRATSRTEAQRLASYARDDPRRARDLIRDPQSWVETGSWQLRNALGLLANAACHYAGAEMAFVEAQDRCPAEQRALMLMRARDAAANDDRPKEAEALLARARALDDQLVSIRIVDIEKGDDLQQRLAELEARTVSATRSTARGSTYCFSSTAPRMRSHCSTTCSSARRTQPSPWIGRWRGVPASRGRRERAAGPRPHGAASGLGGLDHAATGCCRAAAPWRPGGCSPVVRSASFWRATKTLPARCSPTRSARIMRSARVSPKLFCMPGVPRRRGPCWAMRTAGTTRTGWSPPTPTRLAMTTTSTSARLSSRSACSTETITSRRSRCSSRRPWTSTWPGRTLLPTRSPSPRPQRQPTSALSV
jgi:hypothetical protein